jgi:hypothetical protein
LVDPDAAWVMAGGTERGHGEDRAHDEVDRDDVDRPLRYAGELLQQTAGVRDDDRLGHPEPADPARMRFGQRRLDDRRTHDRHWHRALRFHQRLLAEGLRVRVCVGPSQAGGPGPPGVHELIGHPPLAPLFCLGGQGGCAGRTQLGAGVGSERLEHVLHPAAVLGVGSRAAGRGHLAPPVEIERERTFGDQLLGGRPAAVPRHVARRHGDQVRCDAGRVEHIGDARRADEVHLDGGVDRRVERHCGCGVDHDVAPGEERGVVGGQPQAVGPDVAGDHPEATTGLGRQAVASPVRPQAVERAVAQDLTLDALGGRRPAAGSHQQHQLAVGDGSQQALDQRRADEARRSGDGDPLASERLGDHGSIVYHLVENHASSPPDP